MPYCCVTGCRSGFTKTQQPGIYLLRFPVDVERRKAWIEAIGRKDCPSDNVSLCICSLHFEESMIDRTSVNIGYIRLKKDAVPTIFNNTFPSYTKMKKKYNEVTTTSVNTVNKRTVPAVDAKILLEKDAVPTISHNWLFHTKSKKECSEVTETVNVEEASGSCSKVNPVSEKLSNASSGSEGLAKVDSVSERLSDSSSNLQLKLTTVQLKRKIEYLEHKNELKMKKIKSLKIFKRRTMKKIKKLNDIITCLKENGMEEDSLKVSTFNKPMFLIGKIIFTNP